MVTKLKKSKFYSRPCKFGAFLGLILFTVGVVASLTAMFWATYNLSYNLGPVFNSEYNDYTETYVFKEEFRSLMDMVVEVNILYKSEGNVRDGKAVDEDELLRRFKSYYGIADGIITSSTEITDDYQVQLVSGTIPEELMDNFNEYSDLVSTKLRSYKSVYIQNQLDNFIFKKRELDSYANFCYYIENERGKAVAGNAEKNEIISFEQYLILDGEFLSDKMKAYSGYSNSIITNGNYKLYAGVPNVFAPGDNFYDGRVEFEIKKQTTPYILGAGIFCALMIIGLAIYLIRVTGQETYGGEVKLRAIDKMYNDIHFLAVFSAAVLSLVMASFIGARLFYYNGQTWYVGFGIGFSILAVIDMMIGISFLCTMSRQIKARILIKNTLIASVFRKVGETLSGKSFTGWIITLYGLYTLTCLVLYSLSERRAVFGLILALFMFIVALILIRTMESLTKIMKVVKSASVGDYQNIDIKKMSPSFSEFASDINNIQSGLKMSISEAVKSERMKADLITNVSHDLKTPLTSIVSYVDLLDRLSLDNEVAKGYIDVLVDKSKRLKQLIEDLIEASKASSGNLSIEKTKIDLKQLILQAFGEFEDKAKEAKLEFRISAKDDVFVNADGKHMWRIYENLFSNVIKYAMTNSRVYVDIFIDESYGIMSMKNVSQDEINVNVENLAERFIRGDDSRSTEGSGLGLSIAKSLVVLQDGKFEIEADGDLFKVTVKMPLYKELLKNEESE